MSVCVYIYSILSEKGYYCGFQKINLLKLKPHTSSQMLLLMLTKNTVFQKHQKSFISFKNFQRFSFMTELLAKRIMNSS